MDKACSTHGRDGKCTLFVAKPEGKRPLRRPRHRWEDNIKMDIMEICWEGVNWIYLAQEKDHWKTLMNMGISFWVP